MCHGDADDFLSAFDIDQCKGESDLKGNNACREGMPSIAQDAV
jgi:hypothetical protein